MRRSAAAALVRADIRPSEVRVRRMGGFLCGKRRGAHRVVERQDQLPVLLAAARRHDDRIERVPIHELRFREEVVEGVEHVLFHLHIRHMEQRVCVLLVRRDQEDVRASPGHDLRAEALELLLPLLGVVFKDAAVALVRILDLRHRDDLHVLRPAVCPQLLDERARGGVRAVAEGRAVHEDLQRLLLRRRAPGGRAEQPRCEEQSRRAAPYLPRFFFHSFCFPLFVSSSARRVRRASIQHYSAHDKLCQ